MNKKKSHSWFQNNTEKYATVMFVEATPGDKLLKMLKATEDKFRIADNLRIKFVSKCGPKLVQMFHKKDPFKDTCGAHDCTPCAQARDSGDQPQNCRKNNITYMAKCVNCEKEGKQRVYYGETSRNLYIRSKEHYADVISKQNNSWMYRHMHKEHIENVSGVKFCWRILGSTNKPLTRQLTEAVKIRSNQGPKSLNTKTEFNAQRVHRIVIDNSKSKFDCKTCGHLFENETDRKNHDVKFHKIVVCNQCNEDNFGERALQEHVKNNHKPRDQVQEN